MIGHMLKSAPLAGFVGFAQESDPAQKRRILRKMPIKPIGTTGLCPKKGRTARAHAIVIKIWAITAHRPARAMVAESLPIDLA
jgi:hypothetical protein